MKYFILAPWKLSKSSHLSLFIQDFLNRISKSVHCEIVMPSSNLEEKDAIHFYTKEIKKISSEKPICFALDENGNTHTSASFSKELKQQEIQAERAILFCLGGAYGIPKEIIPLVRVNCISLSKLTFPHELALAVLVEQIYRARCIMINHPYHHGEKSDLIKAL